MKFSSKKESDRFDELALLLQSGEISELRIHPQFTLQDSYTKSDGMKVEAIRYTADFSYMRNGKLVVEDVKSRATKTTDYKLRKILMAANRGIDVIEV